MAKTINQRSKNMSNNKKFFFIVILLFLLIGIFNSTAQAVCDPRSGDPMGCIPPDVYSSKTIEQIVVDILNAALGLVFIIVFSFIVYGGYYWMMSAGNEEKIKKSKQILTASFIGLIIILGSLSITNIIVGAIGGSVDVPEGTGLTSKPLADILIDLLNVALGFVTVASLGFLIYGGYYWMISGGDEKKVETAKQIIKSAIIGLIVILISWGVITFIVGIVGGTLPA